MEEKIEHNEYYNKLIEYQETNRPLWQAIITATDGSSPAKAGMKMLISQSGMLIGNLGGGEMEHAIIAYVRDNQPDQALQLSFSLGSGSLSGYTDTSMICGGSAHVFIEVLHNPHRLYIIGAGHCGKALGKLAKLCGYWVHLIDNREDILQSAPTECYHAYSHSDYHDLSSIIEFNPQARIVIMTHGHIHDKQVLQQCLRREFAYLGMIGSGNKVNQTFDNLLSQGFTAEDLAKVHAPIGIRIGSQSPYEIAVSIMAEIIRHYRLGVE